jgi:CheY-like chemotaxis protein
MSSVSTTERPVALVVEDRRSLLDTRRKLLVHHGFQAIGAMTVSDALREFRATPAIDIVVTDINLDEYNKEDRSGIELARALRDRRPRMPLMAISGQIDTLDTEEKSTFDDYLLKGALNVTTLEEKLQDWRHRALEYRQHRAEKAKSELARLRNVGAASEVDVEVLRDFLPGAHLTHEDPADFQTPDDMLRKEGWRLRLVDAGFAVTDSDGLVSTSTVVPFWLKQEGGLAIAVLHSHSCIYHDGANDDEAVKGALELMFGYAQEFKKDTTGSDSAELAELREYLQKVF